MDNKLNLWQQAECTIIERLMSKIAELERINNPDPRHCSEYRKQRIRELKEELRAFCMA